MLDLNLILENIDLFKENQKKRFNDPEVIDKLFDKSQKRGVIYDKCNILRRNIKTVSIQVSKKGAVCPLKTPPPSSGEHFSKGKKNIGNDETNNQPEPSDHIDFQKKAQPAPLNPLLQLNFQNYIKEAELSELNSESLKELSKTIHGYLKGQEIVVKSINEEIDELLSQVGNILHPEVIISKDERNNKIVSEFVLNYDITGEGIEDRQEEMIGREVIDGTKMTFSSLSDRLGSEEKLKIPSNPLSHSDVMKKIGLDTETGTTIAGNRGYIIKGDLFLLQQALIQYSIAFLVGRDYEPIYLPFLMKRSVMDSVAQLREHDEMLYQVSTGNTKDNCTEIPEKEKDFLIATSEQPIVAMHANSYIVPNELPKKFAGLSTCFRKESGSHGRDTLGIFRVHQFEKIEQFCLTEPKESWNMMENMINISADFYQSLRISYRVVDIVSGELNNAASRKYDLEAWFPISKSYKELVSCSNCTDYQSRSVRCLLGYPKKKEKGEKRKNDYVHMLNSTLCAVTRTLCVICETYQTDDGIVVPEVLKPFMLGKEMLKWR